MPPQLNRRALLTSIVLVVLVACAAAVAHGQVAVGDTLRFRYGILTARGELVALSADSIMVRGARGDSRYAIAGLRDVELLIGRHRAGWSDVGKGAAIGFGAGSILALVAANEGGNAESRELVGIAIIGALVVGTTTGIVAGTATSFRHVEAWASVVLAPRIAGAPPAARNVVLGDSIRFEIGGVHVDHAKLIAATRDTLVIQRDDGSRPFGVPAAAMVNPEVLRGQRKAVASTVFTSAVVGSAIGMVFGAFTKEPVLPLLGLGAGAVVGAVASQSPVQDWQGFDVNGAGTAH